MINTILFDLDGTLLPLNNDMFIKEYFNLLSAKLAPHGFAPRDLVDAVWRGTAAMVRNNGQCSNEAAFWNEFAEIFGKESLEKKELFEAFYKNEFQKVKDCCGYTAAAKEVIYLAKQNGYRVALATNPIFPAIATESRICWAGLEPDDFELYTTYENIGYCKPNPDFYEEILKRLKCEPGECLMVGNDVDEDMVAGEIGMKVFLLTDCLINKSEKDITNYKHGSFEDLKDYIVKLK